MTPSGHLDTDACYRAVQSRDRRFDGVFYTAVRTTGIYCRPSCPAVTPKRRNAEFYPTAAAAQSAGYRACRRCLPDAVPGSPEWNLRADLAARASEAAAAQGKFWEMYEKLIPEDALVRYPDLRRYAAEIGLDVDRFLDDLHAHRYVDRIERDIHSADASGAVGTPALFVNGRRQEGCHDVEALTAAIERELYACTADA